jgi:hypothetical protein
MTHNETLDDVRNRSLELFRRAATHRDDGDDVKAHACRIMAREMRKVANKMDPFYPMEDQK